MNKLLIANKVTFISLRKKELKFVLNGNNENYMLVLNKINLTYFVLIAFKILIHGIKILIAHQILLIFYKTKKEHYKFQIGQP